MALLTAPTAEGQGETVRVLEQFLAQAEQLEALCLEDRLIGLRHLAEQLEDQLSEPALLVAVSRAVAQLAKLRRCETLLGASPMGAKVAAGAVVAANDGLGLFRTGR